MSEELQNGTLCFETTAGSPDMEKVFRFIGFADPKHAEVSLYPRPEIEFHDGAMLKAFPEGGIVLDAELEDDSRIQMDYPAESKVYLELHELSVQLYLEHGENTFYWESGYIPDAKHREGIRRRFMEVFGK